MEINTSTSTILVNFPMKLFLYVKTTEGTTEKTIH